MSEQCPAQNSSLSITLTRHLHLPNAPGPPRAPLQITDTLATVHFRGPEYVAHPGTEGVALLVFDVPARARTVKGGERHGGEEDAQSKEPLFEVRCTLNVRFAMPIGRCVVRPLHAVARTHARAHTQTR